MPTINTGIFKPAPDDMIGKVFTRLTVLREVARQGNSRIFECRCDCGNLSKTSRQNLIGGEAKSCGCFRAESAGGWYTSTTGTFRCSDCLRIKPVAARVAHPVNGKPICGVCNESGMKLRDPAAQRARALKAKHNVKSYAPNSQWRPGC